MEHFTEEEKLVLAPFFTNLDKPVFALRNLPEVVKSAMFARYSRSSKSLRRLFLDEFAESITTDSKVTDFSDVNSENAKQLFERVFVEYGDDSVAQLGGAHIAVEGISNIATKLLERGRLMSYLEQSTRYIRYDKPRNDSFLYMRPAEIHDTQTAEIYHATMDDLFRLYSKVTDQVNVHIGGKEGDGAWKRAALAASLDAARGILPASTVSNVGVYGSGQAYEALIMRLYAHPLVEAREIAQNILSELEHVIPSFVKRVNRPERGGVWIEYLAEKDEETRELTQKLFSVDQSPSKPQGFVGDDETGIEVKLLDFDVVAEDKILAAILTEHSNMDYMSAWQKVCEATDQERLHLMGSYVGNRSNRRHRPGRAFESAIYSFEILSDYGAFRDMQRHRMLTIEWQNPTIENGYVRPQLVDDSGCGNLFDEAMEKSYELHEILKERYPEVAPYSTCMAHRIRYTMTMNARELMHLTELRSAPQGHPAYRTAAQKMYKLVKEEAQHNLVADALTFINMDPSVGPGRLEAEKQTESRKK